MLQQRGDRALEPRPRTWEHGHQAAPNQSCILPRASSSSTGRVGARMKATRILLRAALLLLLGALLQLVVLLSFLLCLVVIAASRLLLSLHRALLS